MRRRGSSAVAMQRQAPLHRSSSCRCRLQAEERLEVDAEPLRCNGSQRLQPNGTMNIVEPQIYDDALNSDRTKAKLS